jgi:hypothetical protein
MTKTCAIRPDRTTVRIFAGTFLALALAALAPAERPRPHPSGFLVRMAEGQNDLSRRGVNVHDCIVVMPDGHFHLERRRQQLPSPSARLTIVDSSLDNDQLRLLQSILDDEAIEKLPPYAQPVLPMAVPWSRGFDAKIARDSGVQRVGFWLWRGGTPEASPNSAPDDIKKGWRESETALRPLLDWFHSVEALNLRPSYAASSTCDAL